MGSSFGSLDIILFAVIALFLVYRLIGLLGKDVGFKKGIPASPVEPIVKPSPDEAPMTFAHKEDRLLDKQFSEGPVGEGIGAIKAYDSEFTVASFTRGARSAFECIFDAYAHKDQKTLKSLLEPSVYKKFTGTWDTDSQDPGVLVGIDEAQVVEASVEGTMARVKVRFISQKIGSHQEISPPVPKRVVDIWTFSRELSSQDPNWKLAATH